MGCASSTGGHVEVQKETLEVEGSVEAFYDAYLLGVKLGKGTFSQVRAVTPAGRAGRCNLPNEIKCKEQAVKVIDLKAGAKHLDKVRNEATIWQIIGLHSNIVQLYEIFQAKDVCFMVMDKCSSGLLQYLERRPFFTERSLGNVLAQMLSGIGHLHGLGIVHRSISPRKFMVGGEDGHTVKLRGFDSSAVLPKEGKLIGLVCSSPFACPEMLAGSSYDEKADMWSFAVLAYVLLFGGFPYSKAVGKKSAQTDLMVMESSVPAFVAMGQSTVPGDQFRSPGVVEFAKSLLRRAPGDRPSAIEASSAAFIQDVMSNCYLPDATLPSLWSTLCLAKEAGAFKSSEKHGTRRSRGLDIDVLLNRMQIERHGTKLPEDRASGRQVSINYCNSNTWEQVSELPWTTPHEVPIKASKGSSSPTSVSTTCSSGYSSKDSGDDLMDNGIKRASCPRTLQPEVGGKFMLPNSTTSEHAEGVESEL